MFSRYRLLTAVLSFQILPFKMSNFSTRVYDGNTRSPAVARVRRPYRLYLKAGVRLLVAERKRFPRVTAVPCMLWRPCYNQRQDTIRCAHGWWLQATTLHSKLRPNCCRQTWLLLTVCSSSSPYPTMLSSTYRLATTPRDWHSRVRNDPSKSSKVDDFCVIWKDLCDFLIVINNNFSLISHRFRNTAT